MRRATRADIASLLRLERANSTSSGWAHTHYEDLFNIPASELFFAVAEYPAQLTDAASDIVAFLVARDIRGEWDLQYAAVSKKSQRQGIGARLLSSFIEYAGAANGTAIFLEVRESNRGARALYEKKGFKETGLRKNYYHNPVENAVLYRLSLCVS
jgi:[ribosomal protein S18]-alanine N-acetyltransferase